MYLNASKKALCCLEMADWFAHRGRKFEGVHADRSGNTMCSSRWVHAGPNLGVLAASCRRRRTIGKAGAWEGVVVEEER